MLSWTSHVGAHGSFKWKCPYVINKIHLIITPWSVYWGPEHLPDISSPIPLVPLSILTTLSILPQQMPGNSLWLGPKWHIIPCMWGKHCCVWHRPSHCFSVESIYLAPSHGQPFIPKAKLHNLWLNREIKGIAETSTCVSTGTEGSDDSSNDSQG
jgi:hypothetical protein